MYRQAPRAPQSGRQSCHGPARPAGFTLVELLVVIGIIALLISILLPSLNKARESARKVACASNQRELSNMLRIYATEYEDQVPYGHIAEMSFNYVINWNNSSNGPFLTSFGLLNEAGLMPTAKAFYCPTEERDLYQYDTPANPWEFDNAPGDRPRLTNPGAGHIRIGYGARPDTDWYFAYPPQDALTGQNRPGVPVRLFEDLRATKAGEPVRAFPRFAKLGNKALLSDFLFAPGEIERRHEDGVNVAYGDSSVRYVKSSTFEDEQYMPPALYNLWAARTGYVSGYEANKVMLSENPDKIAMGNTFGIADQTQGIWKVLDDE